MKHHTTQLGNKTTQQLIPIKKIEAVTQREKQNAALFWWKRDTGLARGMMFHIWFRLFARLIH